MVIKFDSIKLLSKDENGRIVMMQLYQIVRSRVRENHFVDFNIFESDASDEIMRSRVGANQQSKLEYSYGGFDKFSAYRPVALKPNEEEKKLEWWVSSLEYLSKQQNVEERHTLQRKGIPVSESMSDNIPKKDGKLCGKVDKLSELEMQEGGKVDKILELVQEVVSKQNILEVNILNF
ncbi:hypothetical protein L1987_32698 [Smallanthus sonchifolius]|uniref:Uncharacterized protein n=1 Tax=Smallanthus sonchifolius TaxID=185202 RepID=A0ACB9HQC1_9ASTR|nr:hypothetical protein L1987_32698 [Smallanthus sonchifolius]